MTQMIVLALDGEAILLRNITVSATMQLPDKDMSGQSTSTTSAQQGNKAKELRVSGVIDFNDEAILTRIFQLAEATESNGAKKHIALLTLPRRQSICDRGYFLVALMPRNNREKCTGRSPLLSGKN